MRVPLMKRSDIVFLRALPYGLFLGGGSFISSSSNLPNWSEVIWLASSCGSIGSDSFCDGFGLFVEPLFFCDCFGVDFIFCNGLSLQGFYHSKLGGFLDIGFSDWADVSPASAAKLRMLAIQMLSGRSGRRLRPSLPIRAISASTVRVYTSLSSA